MSVKPPVLIDVDPVALTAHHVKTYEALVGRTLQPAQVERLIIDQIVYEGTLIRLAAQDAALQNLPQFARGTMLDYIAASSGVARLPALPARTTIQFTLIGAQAQNMVIAKGARIASKDDAFIFLTDDNLTIKAGVLTGTVTASCQTPSLAANGYLAGEVATLLDPIAFVDHAANTTVTSGGADAETDDHLRVRVLDAPHTYSVAGPAGSYRGLVGGVHADIVDVGVIGPDWPEGHGHGIAGQVHIYPLMKDGAPSAEVLALVAAAANPEKVRPVGDKVSVLSPEAVEYSVVIDVIATATANTDAVKERIETAVADLTGKWSKSLGMAIVPAALAAAAQGVFGAHSVAATSPAYTALTKYQWPLCTGITVNIVGTANG